MGIRILLMKNQGFIIKNLKIKMKIKGKNLKGRKLYENGVKGLNIASFGLSFINSNKNEGEKMNLRGEGMI